MPRSIPGIPAREFVPDYACIPSLEREFVRAFDVRCPWNPTGAIRLHRRSRIGQRERERCRLEELS